MNSKISKNVLFEFILKDNLGNTKKAFINFSDIVEELKENIFFEAHADSYKYKIKECNILHVKHKK